MERSSVTDLAWSIEPNPAEDDVRAPRAGLTEHALPITGSPGFQPIGVFARATDGRVVAGAFGLTSWNWLHISLVWVSPELRRQGTGRQLITAIEDAARVRGCTHAHLDTFSYQARPFYEKLGYEVFGALEDYPPGHQRFFLRKRLG
jgi:GNAT superfamily N-acetyltransferase